MICHERGKQALTRFEVLERETDRTRLLLKPVTGRSHQLRIHLANWVIPSWAVTCTPTRRPWQWRRA